ncbi:Signal transduction histidine-protein kinase BaeS [compost metagenome]|nr:two-component sensor histidine kinase [Pseudomonas sp. MYb187]
MGLIASGAVVLMALIMWSRFLWWNVEIQSKIPPAARVELERLFENPQGNEAELWAYMSQYYHFDDILPGITGNDWWTIAFLLCAALPVIVVTGFLLLRPLSSRFVDIAHAAQKVAGGDLSVKLPLNEQMPLEVQQLSSDFNSMTRRLQLYEQEVQASSAVLTHELRTPLNAAMGRVRGMLDDVFPANPEQLGMVLHQLENINVLVDDLLLLSLAQAGQLPLTKTTFTLQSLLDERINWFKPYLAAVGRDVFVAALPFRPIHCDRNRIGQVINILLENYIRYASAAGNLEIRGTADQRGITLIFSDRGPGLSGNELERVFQRFWRQEPSRDRRAGGSGLGLSIALAICTAHGGAIAARRRGGGGIAFEVFLPYT